MNSTLNEALKSSTTTTTCFANTGRHYQQPEAFTLLHKHRNLLLITVPRHGALHIRKLILILKQPSLLQATHIMSTRAPDSYLFQYLDNEEGRYIGNRSACEDCSSTTSRRKESDVGET